MLLILCLTVFLVLSPPAQAQAPTEEQFFYELYTSSSTAPHYRRLAERELKRIKLERELEQAQQAGGTPPSSPGSGGGAISAQAAKTQQADPSFVLRDIYVFPNPARGGAKPTIHVEVGVADKVEIRFYNIAGELIHSVEITSPPKVINSVYAYEYRWEAEGTASGVYIYLVRAFKEGRPTIKALKKLALIK